MTPIIESLSPRVLRCSYPLTFLDALRRWQDDEAFRAAFLAVLKDAPFAAYRWETPRAEVSRPFEFVLVDDPGLDRAPDPSTFRKHFTDANAVAFPNLSGDATLIVPTPRVEPSAYVHLASFVRGAPDAQQHAFWQLVGKTMEQRLGPPAWLSTAGAGVAWLHVRIDARPKYYSREPYRA